MQLIEVNQSEKSDYNNFVAAHGGSFLQAWEWGMWQEKLGKQILRYWILDMSGNKVAAVQFIKMPIAGKKFYLYAPYGPILAGGKQASEKLKVESDEWVQKIQKHLINNFKKGHK